MAENQILPFAYADGANVLSQTDYVGDNQRLIGHQPGIARSALENKALRQATLMAAGVGQFIADKQTADVTDGLTPQEVSDMLTDALDSLIMSGYDGGVTGGNGWIKLPNGTIIQWINGIMPQAQNTTSWYTQTVQLALPVAFPTECQAIVVSSKQGGQQPHIYYCGALTNSTIQIVCRYPLGVTAYTGYSYSIVAMGV